MPTARAPVDPTRRAYQVSRARLALERARIYVIANTIMLHNKSEIFTKETKPIEKNPKCM